MQSHHFTHDDQGGWFRLLPFHYFQNIAQRTGKYPLRVSGSLLYQCNRHIGGYAVGDELLADHRQSFKAHVKHHGLMRLGQLLPVQVHAVVFEMPGYESN